ncbi:MAG: thiamine pyrophosphate-binding protein [Alphaproteobacteria bacterium]|jgi:acetolactate synthase I/II/III large subunit|nr:thiamine pyrophosphate-binding protein [Alphaproteobacteria bacterium]MBT4017732.1 thiamine pyrophosphate-binding protein [Alphaproteobacteria bacterium]MBT4966571.1 thiamine pyrophosphate-binding protein [Alphaproteobacteria bacterium]MBT5161749.1 thiamine pyrophosphate-binding protein [Alphaproteobacteria bacterium]MBT6386487.1 thiamine pyrophosphate-binding protein [Alphaproteobacteria bacterium]
MRKTGAELAVHALEQIGVRYTFGVPGVHNTEIYDEMNSSDQIHPVLVTHEGGGAFMADAISRTTNSIGTLVIVPAAGVTHAASGIGEAYLDGIPMLVVCGGIDRETDKTYQLHEMDQKAFIEGLTKRVFLVEDYEDIIPMLFEAYDLANSGKPGPVFVEIPVNLQRFKGDVAALPVYEPPVIETVIDLDEIRKAVAILRSARRPGIFAGWGANGAKEELKILAERLDAPVSTTLQGLGTFPGDHPLHTGLAFGPSAVPASRNAFAGCDVMLAIGTRFSEIGTGFFFSAETPENLIHVDIDPDVFNKNYPAKVALAGDSKKILEALLNTMGNDSGASNRARTSGEMRINIATDKNNYRTIWQKHDSKGRVNPESFFSDLRQSQPENSIFVVDDGNHTFLTAELLPINEGDRFIGPTDFNCMGYAVPAAIGAKLANPDTPVAAIVGDGCFTMTCMELLTASRQEIGPVFYVFNDGELSQIAQAQRIVYNRTPCTGLEGLNLEGVALATGAHYLGLSADDDPAAVMAHANRLADESNRPVIVDVAIDYSKKSAYTQGAAKTSVKRLPLREALRFVGRITKRKITG